MSKDAQTLIGRKQFSTVGHLADALVNQEKLIGADKIAKPVNGEITKWFGENREAVGVPAKAEDYKLPDIKLPEGQEWDKDLETRARAFALERNIPQDLFAEFAAFVVEDRSRLFTVQQEHVAAEEAQAKAALEQKWGAKNYDANVETAKLAARHFGYDAEFLAKLEAGMGSVALIEHFHKIGTMIDESELVSGDNVGLRTPATDAQKRIDALKQDGQFQKTLRNRGAPGHKEASQQWTRLHELAAGEAKKTS